MGKFIEDSYGTLWPVDRIACVMPYKKEGGDDDTAECRTIDGAKFGIKDDTFLALRAGESSTIPALPGTFLLSVFFETEHGRAMPGTFLILRNQILGWRVPADECARPEPIIVDPDGLPGNIAQRAILMPGGTVESHSYRGGTDGCVWHTFEEFETDMQANFKALCAPTPEPKMPMTH